MTNPYHSSNPKMIGGTLHTCPICGKHFSGRGALSRKDNKTTICSMCGQEEALEDYQGYLKIAHEKENK